MVVLAAKGSSGEFRPGSDAIFWYRREGPWDAAMSPALPEGLAAEMAELTPALQGCAVE